MSLEPGQKLAHYEIVEPIGKGGMGEVFRALDGKLGRDVAIKVLPEEFSRDGERLARFKREAKVLASLNHPNIAAIYGFEQADETHFLVLELVPGETLADRIARGPIPIDEATAIAIKIAEGLEAAYEQGIVHRDLKPANIKLTPDDKVKILDFGLAKAFVDEGPAADDSMSPTITRDATRVGVILGTAAYMSPEQAKGKRVDRRADIFAFGSVLYEMLTGRKAFRGEGVSEVLAAVMKDEPDWNALPSGTPALLRRMLHRCLAKPVAKRLQHVGDARLDLETPEGEVAGTQAGADRNKALLWTTTLAAVVAIGVSGWAVVQRDLPEPKPIVRWRLSLPPGASLSKKTAPSLAISPDGRHLAYVLTRAGETQLYLKAADALDAIPVEGAVNASVPFFSPDSETLAFLSPSGNLMRVSVKGGIPVAIADTGIYVRGASWNVDGRITYAQNSSGGVHRVAAAGGDSEVLALPDRTDGVKGLWFPDVLPSGDVVLVTLAGLEHDSYDDSSIAAVWANTREERILLDGGTSARYSPSGHIVYARAGALYAAPFDAENVDVTGDPVRVLEGVTTYPTMGQAEFSLSGDGSLLYAPGEPLLGQNRIVWVDRTGKATTLVDEPRPYGAPSLSPDGRSLGVITNDANLNIWRYDLAQSSLTRIVSGGNNFGAVWTPDGSHIAFMSNREGTEDLFSIPADGSGPSRMLLGGEMHQSPLSWAPDGRTLLFRQRDVADSYDLWLWTDDGETVPVVATAANESWAEIAPNGRWMAYQSDESGRAEIYVCAFPSGESRRRVSVDGGVDPRWNPDGRELFYRNGREMQVVDVDSGETLALGRPRVLFESDLCLECGYDVGANGERFVMIDSSETPQPPTELVLVQNWAEELKRLVPVN